MSSKNAEQKLPSANRSLLSTVLCSLELIAFGVFLLVLYFINKENPLPEIWHVETIWLPATLGIIWLISLTHSAVLKNTVTLWVSFVFLTCLAAWLLVNVGGKQYIEIYPIYIAIPAIASAGTILFSKDKNIHLKSIVFFGIISFFLFLNSLGDVSWFVLGPLIVVIIGAFIFINAITSRKGRWDDGDRPQRSTPYPSADEEDKK
ncbi:MAG TPA: hypothetical protein VIL03_06340 [Clostridia bacterium]|jgi:hypothetical protein